MIFKEYFNTVAETLDLKFKALKNVTDNPQDKGELCEIFIKQFLNDCIGDSFKIFRGGKIVDYKNIRSKQIDIILTGKRSIKIFSDKGLYPTETVYGCFSITATLKKQKILDCYDEFLSIPKDNHTFHTEAYLGPYFAQQYLKKWRWLIPYKCVFAFQGDLDYEWINDLIDLANDELRPTNVLPDLVIVNKVGYFHKYFDAKKKVKFNYVKFKDENQNYGIPFSIMLYELDIPAMLTPLPVILTP